MAPIKHKTVDSYFNKAHSKIHPKNQDPQIFEIFEKFFLKRI